MAIADADGSGNEPRKVKLKSRKHSFGFKVRGQVSQGGPRWLIDGKEYNNLQTVSEVQPESAANDGGVLPGDKILSINGIEVEGIEHERFKELMKNSGDEVELVVITPSDARMLDIPSSVTIHRSDGSTLSINDPDVLKSQNIDQAIQNEEKKVKAADALAHSTIIEIDSDEALGTVDTADQGDTDIEDDPESNLVDKMNGSLQVQEESEHESQDEHSVSLELGDLPEEPDATAQIENEEETCSIIIEDDPASAESLAVSVNIDGVAETSFIDPSTEDLQENEDNSESICASEPVSITSDEKQSSRKQKTRKRGIRFLPKKPKVRPFSPDTFNNLSPYYTRIKVRPFEIEQKPTCSWKYNQRPTSLSVLHPSDAFRLESEDHQNVFAAWSSNLSKRKTSSDVTLDDQAQRIRRDIYSISKLVDWRNSRISYRRISQKRMSGLSEPVTSTRQKGRGVNV